MEEKKKGGKRAAPNRRGWLLAVLVLAGLGIWGILEWRAHTAPGWTFPAIRETWTGPP